MHSAKVIVKCERLYQGIVISKFPLNRFTQFSKCLLAFLTAFRTSMWGMPENHILITLANPPRLAMVIICSDYYPQVNFAYQVGIYWTIIW